MVILVAAALVLVVGIAVVSVALANRPFAAISQEELVGRFTSPDLAGSIEFDASGGFVVDGLEINLLSGGGVGPEFSGTGRYSLDASGREADELAIVWEAATFNGSEVRDTAGMGSSFRFVRSDGALVLRVLDFTTDRSYDFGRNA